MAKEFFTGMAKEFFPSRPAEKSAEDQPLFLPKKNVKDPRLSIQALTASELTDFEEMV